MAVSGVSGGTNYKRITGLATNMDTDGMVKQMVAGDNLKLDQLKQNKTIFEWQQEAYIDIINDLKDFQNSYLDILAPEETNLMSGIAYSGLKAQSSDETKIKAIAFGGALKGNYKIKVDQIAEGARKQSNILNLDTSLTTKLSDLKGEDGTALNISGTIKFTVEDGKTFEVTVDPSKTVNEFLSDIANTKSSDGSDVLGNHINVNFSELTKKFTFETKTTGDSSKLTIEDINSGNAASALGINASVQGKNAKISISAPGESAVPIERDKNVFAIDNVQYDVSCASIGDEVNISVQPDATEKVEKFKKFIDKYNSLIDKIKTKIDDKKQYKYKPLTDEQRKELKDDEIKNWETKAKQGLLHNELSLSSLLTNLRETFYSAVEGAGLTAQDIGITTTNKWKDGGKLALDETKLKEALETRGDQVQKLFTQVSDVKEEKGLLTRFKDTFDQYIGSEGILIKKSGYKDTRWIVNNDLSNKIEEKNKAIEAMEKKIYAKQERYYSMFAVLEKNMNSLNSQSNWLMSQLGGN